MTPRFDLLSEPWIPCIELAGEAPRELSLRETLRRAPELREIADPSPLVVGGLHRLLLAVLHRAFGPEDDATWLALWSGGTFDRAELWAYLDRVADRFDLFDDRHPFYQTPNLRNAKPWPIARLTEELASKTDVTLFDHSHDSDGRGFSPARAARQIIAIQAFALGGLVGREDPADRSAAAAPLANAALVVLRGHTLFQTLMLNLLRYSPANELPFQMEPDDYPAWERDDYFGVGPRRPTGYLDWLTWQSRRIRLGPPKATEQGWLIDSAIIVSGDELPKDAERRTYEAMVAFIPNRQATSKSSSNAWLPLGLSTDRALWRDSLALLSSSSAASVRPQTIDAVETVRYSTGDTTLPGVIETDVIGLLSDRKKKELWRQERFAFPAAFLDDRRLLERLEGALQFAEVCYRRLLTPGFDDTSSGRKKHSVPRPLQLLAATLLAPPDGSPPDQERVKAFVSSLQAGGAYWPRLEAPFRDLLFSLPADRAPDPDADDGQWLYGIQTLPDWAARVEQAARDAFRLALAAVGFDPRGLEASARADARFVRTLAGIVRRYRLETTGGVDDDQP